MKLKITDVIKETPDAISIHFKQPFFSKIKYKPGQFLTLIVDVDGKLLRRAYSINTSPKIDKTVSVTIKRVKDGQVSNKLFETIKPGDTIEVMKPMGNFVFEAAKATQRHFVLFAGGSGITPIISIAKSVLYFEPQSMVSMYYANQTEDSVIFKRKLDELVEQFDDRFTLKHIIDQPSPKWKGESGRLNTEKINLWLQSLPDIEKENTEHYICGPGGMMNVVQESLLELGIGDEHIHIESFTAPQTANTSTGEAQLAFTFKGKTHDVNVTPGKNLLDAILDSGVNVPYSCMSGICGTCKSKLKTGDVAHSEKTCLTKEDQDNGYILPCVCFAASDSIEVEMN